MERMYFVAIVLPHELDKKVLAYKRWMQDEYGCKVGLKSPAHITLVPPFWMPEEKEDGFRAELDALAAHLQPLSLSTNNFDAFRPRTLFVAVEESKPLQQVKKEVDVHFAPLNYKIKTENRPFHPHITIATRDLRKADFATAWQQVEGKPFREKFAIDALSLLKHNGRTWDVVHTAKCLGR